MTINIISPIIRDNKCGKVEVNSRHLLKFWLLSDAETTKVSVLIRHTADNRKWRLKGKRFKDIDGAITAIDKFVRDNIDIIKGKYDETN